MGSLLRNNQISILEVAVCTVIRMRWEKLPFCFNSGIYLDGYDGAAVPQAVPINNETVRVYYSPRDNKNRSHIFYADINVPSLAVEAISTEPILSPGELGGFDDSGTMMSHIGYYDNRWMLYYIGWNLGQTVPFRNSLGLAVSDDGIHFERAYAGPIIDRTKDEPHFCASNWILKEEKYRNWYLSCVKWRVNENGKPEHCYHIKYAESVDGINWERRGRVAIDFSCNSEYAISRPCVIKGNNGYHMWFSHRGDKYRIGYAFSEDGYDWKREDDKAGITVSEDGFDSEMICYPAVFLLNKEYYMLFNGNGYGMTGFGLAKLTEGEL